ncbi:Phosphatidylinositol-3-phosphatase SAC1 [Rhodosporidiobolus nylandii]
MSDTAAAPPSRSERGGDRDGRSAAPAEDDDRRRRDEDLEFERARDRERSRDRRRRDSRDRGDRDRGERRRRDYPDEDYRESKRRRSRSRDRGDGYDRHSSRHRDDYHDRRSRREPSYEPEPRHRRRRSPSYDEYARGPPRRMRSPSPQLSEEQREMRSIFVSQLAARVTDRELGIFFETHAGQVRDARVIVDRITRRSKGVGYVEFVELEAVQKALTLSGTKLLGIPIQVQYTEAEKNRQARNGDSNAGPGSTGPMTGGLYVGSLNFALTSEDIREVFQPFGELETVELHRDPATGKSKGYCFVKYVKHEDAMVAIEKMNNFPLAGREIKVGLVADRSATFNKHLLNPSEQQLEREETTGKLDQNARIELMQKLARADRPPDLPPTPMFRPNIPQNTTRNVLMKNAFNPEEETERDWDLDLAEDVKGECEAQYGKVVDIYVVKQSQGEIYIRFETVDSAVKALAGLNGRWFGGRQIQASHVGDSLFDSNK